jgi:hypothetical protein
MFSFSPIFLISLQSLSITIHIVYSTTKETGLSLHLLPASNLCRNAYSSVSHHWAISGNLSGDGPVIEEEDWYTESLYVTYCLHV